MERTTEIPPQGWFNYFAGLSRRALSHPVRVEVESVQMGAQELVRALPLLGIDVEPRGSELGSIEFTLGDEHQDFLHRIARPVQVYLKIDDNGDLDCLAIEDRSGTRTLLFFEKGDVPAWAHPSIQEAEPPAPGL
ncbi:hypothetical protein CYFUS_007244 [Cystobacter fuscus]|uniref:Uncharacterized protein n=1 Tax=Cystobacter fuscus TaxID=43 RepID=A0A250JCY3_9BACT|nr:DUF5335 family protein [Cystobacter fuscus]ATB41774.1 hypothetical protein CYFUS_007244 [Cystobacter fuscus]